MTDGILDLLVLIALLGVVLAIGFGILVPLSMDSANQPMDLVDKTASSLEYYNSTGESNAGYYGGMTKAEVMLSTQVQDYGMPNPRTIEVDGTKIDITSIYRDERIGYATLMWQRIQGDSANQQYQFTYDNRNPAVDGDEVQLLSRVNPN